MGHDCRRHHSDKGCGLVLLWEEHVTKPLARQQDQEEKPKEYITFKGPFGNLCPTAKPPHSKSSTVSQVVLLDGDLLFKHWRLWETFLIPPLLPQDHDHPVMKNAFDTTSNFHAVCTG